MRLAAIAGVVALVVSGAPKGPSLLPDAGHSCFVFSSDDDPSVPWCNDVWKVVDPRDGGTWHEVWLTSDGGRVECRFGRFPCDQLDDTQGYDTKKLRQP